jgi:N-acetylglucosaminyldiphosphoundecaprenol N-acetyl-beta-D-mannosaminyltransferase
MRQTVGILGIPIDNLDTAATLERLDQFVQERRFHQVATANVDFLINAMHDQELRQILREADLVTPDGMPVVWASRLLGVPLAERVTGADIVPKLAALAAKKGYRVYMLGARPEVAQRAKGRLEQANPGIQIVGCVSPQLSPLLAMDSATLLDDIRKAKPDILLVAFGNPKQEKWIHLHRDHLRDVPICIGIGGTFDFLAGETSRAPGWMQRFGMEWLYRLAQEPKRLWRRYTNDFVHFTRFLARQWWATRAQQKGADGHIHTKRVDDFTIVIVEGALGPLQLMEFKEAAQEALDNSPHLILDMSSGNRLDLAALGTLVNLAKRANHIGREVRLFGAGSALQGLLRTIRADEVLAFYPSLTEALAGSNAEPLKITLQLGKNSAVITLVGKADFEQAHLVKNHLDALSDAIGQVDIDLRGVTYIDCGMLTMLRSESRRPDADARCLRLAINPVVHTVLLREKILNDFVLCDTPDAWSAVLNTAASELAEQRQA